MCVIKMYEDTLSPSLALFPSLCHSVSLSLSLSRYPTSVALSSAQRGTEDRDGGEAVLMTIDGIG